MTARSSADDWLSSKSFANLEYWFFKVNAGPVALLVDWIARRRCHEYVLRASIHSPHQRTVLFDQLAAPMLPAQNFLGADRTVGQSGDLAWAFEIDRGPERIEPDIFPARLLRMTDLALVSAPQVTFSGWIKHGSQRFELERAPGMMTHYWGRQLAHEWWWVSANQFDQADIALECAVFRTSLWGLPVRLPLAYLYLRAGGARRLVMSPPALARAAGTPENFEIELRPLAGPTITLRAHGSDYGDLGEGIANTLVGDLEVWEGQRLIGRATGTAGLERRVPPG